MNNLIRSFLMITYTVFLISNSSAQIATDTILCGTDTVRISLNNFQFGKVSWEESADGAHWVPMGNEYDTLLNYFTTDEKYIRACITTADCEQVFSHRAFIRQVPKAYAGEDKDIMMKDVLLKGNYIQGTTGHWDVRNGSGYQFSDQDSSATVFSLGEGVAFNITYSLENECGASTDTISINYVKNSYNTNHIVIDSLDSIAYSLSDTEAGVYRISFHDMDSVIVKDSVVLVSGFGDGFLRKVTSFEQLDSNTFVFQTIEGTLSDILEDGVLNMGDDIPHEPEHTKSTGHSYLLDHMPTRKELLNDPKFKEGVYIYRSPDRYSYSSVVKAATASEGGFEFNPEAKDSIGDEGETRLIFDLKGKFRFEPNFVCDVRVGFFKLKYLKAGMENAELETGIDVDLEGIFVGDTLIGKELTKTIYKKTKPYTIIAGGIPIVILNTFSLDFIVKPKLRAEFDVEYEWNRTTSFSAYLYKDMNTGLRGIYEKGLTSSSTEYEIQMTGSAGVDLTLEPKVDFRIYGILGPYLAVPVTLSPEICVGGDFNSEDNIWTWGFNVPLSIDARIGCALRIKKWTLFDRSVTFNLYESGFYYPNSIAITSGNSQNALPYKSLLRPLEVKLKTTWGFPAPGIPVFFKVVEGDAILDDSFVFSGTKGLASTNLTLGNSLYNLIQVEAINCDLSYLSGGENLFFEVNSSCKNSSLALSLIFQEDETVQLLGVMGREPYSYSLEREEFSEAFSNPNIYDVMGQPLYVKDADGCIATNQVNAFDTCRYSELSVSVYLESTNALAMGEYGTPPYEYSLNDEFNFSLNNEFHYLNPGNYELFIRDSSGCTSSIEFPLKIEMTDSLIAFYPFNGDARDESGHSHHGLVDGARMVPDRFGNENSSFLFEATDLITVTSHEDFTMEGDFSISFWTYSTYDPSKAPQSPISFGDPGSNDGLHMVFESSADCPLNLFSDKGATELCFIDQITQYQLQEWHHFVVVRKLDTLTLYCDAVPLGKMEVKDVLFNSSDLHIGNTYGKENGLRGSVDDIRIYNRILFPSEINSLFNENGWDDGSMTDVLIDRRDDNSYGQVRIGNQVWMAENLKWLPSVNSNDETSHEDPRYYVYEFNGNQVNEAVETAEYNTYGVLYNHPAAINACPDGWHLPSEFELHQMAGHIVDKEDLEDYNGWGYYGLGIHLKADYGWSVLGNGTNDYDFSALPGNGWGRGSWWTRDSSDQYRFSFTLEDYSDDLFVNYLEYGDGVKSLRCIRDEVVVLPTIATDTASAIGSLSAICGGYVIDDGGNEVSSRGICWNTLPNPDTNLDTKTSETPGEGRFSSQMTGLDPETTYYVRAYATNSAGTAYGKEVSFTTAPQLIDMDGNVYGTVIIGNQLWLAENLRTSRYNDGILIQKVVDEFDFGPQSVGEYGWYDNDSTSFEAVFGKLYNWYAVNTGNLCPAGWHVPEDSELTILIDYLGGEIEAGGKLKEAGFSHWFSPNTSATNLSGFTALPGGTANMEMGYWNMGNSGYWWSTTEDPLDPLTRVFVRRLLHDSSAFGRLSSWKEDEVFSVRCVKD